MKPGPRPLSKQELLARGSPLALHRAPSLPKAAPGPPKKPPGHLSMAAKVLWNRVSQEYAWFCRKFSRVTEVR